MADPLPCSAMGNSFGLLLLRLGFGGYMLTHGWGKLQMLLAGNGDKFPDPIGLGNEVSLFAAVGAEFVCSILVMFGVFTRISAVPVAFTMIVAAFVIHGGDPWTMSEGARLFKEKLAESASSKEAALLYAIPFLALIFTGGGHYSFDAWRAARKKSSSSH